MDFLQRVKKESMALTDQDQVQISVISFKGRNTLQGINISHLGKRKIIFKMPFLGDMLVPSKVLFQQDFPHFFGGLWPCFF